MQTRGASFFGGLGGRFMRSMITMMLYSRYCVRLKAPPGSIFKHMVASGKKFGKSKHLSSSYAG